MPDGTVDHRREMIEWKFAQMDLDHNGKRISKDNELKFVFSKKATKNDKIFTVDLTLCSKCQIDCEDFINFCGLRGKHEL